ncbi:MAG: hypothetical protein AAF367_02950 [Pseudomonadota bacterium]
MAERVPRYHRWANALVLLGFGWLAILLQLAPLSGLASAPPSPDLLFCVAAFLLLRRPASTPAFLIVILGLLRDLLGGGPAGLGALVLLAALEVLRLYADLIRRRGFFVELAAIATLVLMMSAFQVVVLALALTPIPPLDRIAMGALMTILAYIGVAILFRWVLRIRPAPEDNGMLIGRARR